MITIDLNLIFVMILVGFVLGIILGVRMARPRSHWE